MGVPLPFKCRCLQDAAQADVNISKLGEPENGKYEVLFPVGLPDEGTFAWLEGFMRENQGYTELSGRALVDWGIKSDLWRKGGSYRACNDAPSMDFGIRDLDG